MFVTGVFEVGREHDADGIEEQNLLDVDDRNAFILAIQLHPLCNVVNVVNRNTRFICIIEEM